MKKFLSVITSFALAFSLAACANADSASKEVTPESVYTEATEKMAELKATDLTVSVKNIMTIEDKPMEMNVNSNVKTVTGANDLKMQMDATTQFMEQDIPMKAYYKDGYFYTDAMEQKIKMPMDLNSAMQEVSSVTGNKSGYLSADMFEGFTMSETEDGYHIECAVKSDKLNQYINDIMKLGSMEAFDSADVSVKANKVSYKFDVNKNDKYIINSVVSLDCEITAQGQTMKTQTDTIVTLNNHGENVEITFPNDLDSYVETNAAAELTPDVEE